MIDDEVALTRSGDAESQVYKEQDQTGQRVRAVL